MSKNRIELLIPLVADKPLNHEEIAYLVNREEEISFLNNVAIHQPFGIVGIAGETGIGKTTVLNFVRPEGVFARRINISLRDSTESILYDLLYSLASSLESERGVSDYAKQIRDWINNEVSSIKGFSLGLSLGMSADVKYEKSFRPKFNFFGAREKLGSLIRKVTEAKGKFLLIIDELDKERKDDVLKIIDSIKNYIILENFVVILSLPFSIYREYTADRLRWNESGNLENVFKDMVFLETMKTSEIKELLIKRIGEHIELVEAEVLDIATEFSDGNPRDALWILTKAVYDNIHEPKLNKKNFVKTVRKILTEYMTISMKLTENQRRAIHILKDSYHTKEKIVERLQESGFKRTTAYSVIEQLFEKKVLLLNNGVYRISGKFKYVEL